MNRWYGFAGALALCGLGCSPEAPTEVSGSRAQAIIDGERSGAEQDGVVLLRAVLDDPSEILCTASLVAPNLIMTARHCVSYTTEGEFACSVRGELIENPTGGGRVGLHLPATSLEIYSGKTPRESPLARGQRVISTLSQTSCENDLAFVVLDTALDLPIVPIRLGRSAQVHERATLVGFGLTEDERVIDYQTQPRLQKRDLEVVGVGPDSIDDGVTTVPPRVLFLQGPSGCIGDSGGPLLAQPSGAVIGIYSLQLGGSCSVSGVRHYLVHVPPFRELIDDAFSASGGEPLLEPTPAAGGAMSVGGASGASDGTGGNDNSELGPAAGGVGGAAGEVAQEPEATPQAAESSGCSVPAAHAGRADAWRLVALLALGALARRRNLAGRGCLRRR